MKENIFFLILILYLSVIFNMAFNLMKGMFQFKTIIKSIDNYIIEKNKTFS